MARSLVSLTARLCAVFGFTALLSASGRAADLPAADSRGLSGPRAAASLPARMPDRGFILLRLKRHAVKWGAAAPGTGAVVRYAFVTEPTERPGAVNCGAMAPFGSRLSGSALRAATFEAEVRHAMAAWEAAIDVRFVPANGAEAADLLIGVQQVPRGIAFADVAPMRAVQGAIVPIRQAAICLNPGLKWEDAFDGDPATPDVRYVVGHEIGHVLGLDHAWGEDKLMSFKYREAFRGPQPGDLAGAIFLYGRRPAERPHVVLTNATPAAEPAGTERPVVPRR